MNIACSTFQTVDGKVATLGDIKANDIFAFAEDNLQLLTGTGGTLAQYTYCNEAWAAEFESTGLKVGWYDYYEGAGIHLLVVRDENAVVPLPSLDVLHKVELRLLRR